VGDFVQERVINRFFWAVLGVIPGDLDPFRSVLARSKPTFGVSQAKRPAMQFVFHHLPTGDGFEFLQIHDSFSNPLGGDAA
jgi:hypothetical protein